MVARTRFRRGSTRDLRTHSRRRRACPTRIRPSGGSFSARATSRSRKDDGNARHDDAQLAQDPSIGVTSAEWRPSIGRRLGRIGPKGAPRGSSSIRDDGARGGTAHGGSEAWRSRSRQSPPPRGELSTTISGAEVEPLSTLETTALDYERETSATRARSRSRAVYPSMYRGRLWTMRQFAGFGTAEERTSGSGTCSITGRPGSAARSTCRR